MKPWQRRLTIGVPLGLLFGTTIGFGLFIPSTDADRYSGVESVRDQPDTLTDSQVTMWGKMIETDPVVLQTGGSRDTPYEITLTGDTVFRAAVGNGIGAHGTLEGSRRLGVEQARITGSGERTYMLYISLFAGLYVITRFLRGWQFEWTTLTFCPKNEGS